jgi:hypothetical protein
MNEGRQTALRRILAYLLGLLLLAVLVWLQARHWARHGPWPLHSESMVVGIMSFLGLPPFVTALLLALPFWLWSPQLLWGDVEIPVRSYFGFASLALAMSWWFVTGMEFASRRHGWAWMLAVLAENLTVVAALACFLYKGRKKPSFIQSFAFHWLLVAWPVTCGFPDIIELP